MKMAGIAIRGLTLVAVLLASPAFAQQPGLVPSEEDVRSAFKKPSYSPYAGRHFPTQVFWGDTVDIENATWTNTIGDPELITVWKDPDFDPKVKAFYYARVLEIPTPRWVVYDAKRYGVKLGDEVWKTLQERAYTSPIWYSPERSR